MLNRLLSQTVKYLMGGLYEIRNTATGKVYVGVAQDFRKRFYRHRYELRHDRYHCLYLQRAWNKYGETAFDFVIIEECEMIEALLLEQERLQDLSNLYNVSPCSSGGDIISQHPDREKIVTKMRASLVKRFEAMTFTERQEIYGRCGERNGMYGRSHTPETRRKISEHLRGLGLRGERSARFGVKASEKTRQKLSEVASRRTGEANHFYGKHHSAETKAKLSEQRKGKKPTNTRPIVADGVRYESVTEAARQLSVTPGLIVYRLKSAKYDYRYEEEA